MVQPIPDRYIWFGLGVFAVAAAYAIRHAITDIVELTVLPKDWNKRNSKDTSKQPEDDLGLNTLKTLSQSPNPHIANSAISLIIQRFAALPDIRQEMAEEFNSPDPETRHRARTITKFLQEYPLPPGMDRVVMPAMPDEEQRQLPSFIPRQAVRADLDGTPAQQVEWFQRNLARNRRELMMLDNEIIPGVQQGRDAGEHP